MSVQLPMYIPHGVAVKAGRREVAPPQAMVYLRRTGSEPDFLLITSSFWAE
ncbi:MAG: hypothetical protein IIA91_04005 [Chloroflexi bacterium]|nr:hypothetical protein [Chloroflexota bacterium]